ncbi:GTP-binding protein [Plasmodium gonderi]|uniref:GTP-binding protein n=1 Tax=Plasmodium gonderi TaxID=77519 RepID=A0A1Y1JRN3_PLAGO|nr:GTP-binding protein [Plasmodium gonderi]GAW82664.1 GTP-binding protein [Plasmodium gonderi]
MELLKFFLRNYSSLHSKLRAEKANKNVYTIKGDVGNNNVISRRQKERSTKLDIKIYEQLKKKMLGKPLNKLQKKYMNEKRQNFAPIFLDQLKPRMILYKTAIQVNELPLPKYPEIAFIGRSNCGKSTLINELCGRTNKAKVSKLPGCTKQIHFYKIAKPCLLCLVDLPGYGFAHSKEELRLQWNEFTLFYLKNRKNLKKVFVLIDCRVGLKTSDKELLHFFDRYNIKYQIVLSKCDLLNTKDLAVKIQIVNEEITCFKNIETPIIPLSSLKRQNLNELRREIARYQLNKTIVKNNIVMKINDLIEQKRLKKLKGLGESHHAGNPHDVTSQMCNQLNNKLGDEGGDHFNFLKTNTLGRNNQKSKNKIFNPNETHSKDILISDDTISEALNRWKNCDKHIEDTCFNKYMNSYMKYIINGMQENFLHECYKEFNKNDLNVIDDIIENCDKFGYFDEKIKDISQGKLKNTALFDMKNIPTCRNGITYMNNKQRKYKKELKLMEDQITECEEKKGKNDEIDRNNVCKGMKVNISRRGSTKYNIEENPLVSPNEICTNKNKKHYMNKGEMTSEHMWDAGQSGDLNYSSGYTKHLEITYDEKHKKEISKYSNELPLRNVDSIELEKELLLESLHLSNNKKNNNYEYVHSENVKMENLFEENKNKTWDDYFKRMDYSKIKGNVLLEEDDTYTSEDYASGLKKSKLGIRNNDPLSSYTFNINDKDTHEIYEKGKSDLYKIYRSRQLENLYIQDNSSLFGSNKNVHKGEKVSTGNSSSQGANNARNKNISTPSSVSNESVMNKKKSLANGEEIDMKKNYIGLKTRYKIIKGTKKLKLFGKKKTSEIVPVPTDLATDYFKLSNNSTFYDKKQNSWNYINSKYNKWLKKINRKKISTEITSPVKKVDVMVRYAQKQESKYKKEKNKLLMRKNNLGMITKPPNHKKAKKISRNYTLSDEQKIFDREAFFKYRDVQK